MAGPKARAIGFNHIALEVGDLDEALEYGEIQFSKSPEVLRGMGLGSLGKSPEALAELREKGLAD